MSADAHRCAGVGGAEHTGPVGDWTGLTYLLAPLAAFVVVGILALLLRWAFGRGGSLVERRPQAGAVTDYGMLVSVASPGSYVEAEVLRRRLVDAGLRATVARTHDGPRLMVFPGDTTTARRLLAGL